MDISYEDFWVAAGRAISSDTASERYDVIYYCMDWCKRKGYVFIQCDFELKVFYYGSN